MHAHPCPVVLIGLSGRFRLTLDDHTSFTAHSAVVGAGVRHVFDPQGEQIATLYLEPDDTAARALLPLLMSHRGVLVDVCAPIADRATTASRLHHVDLDGLLAHTLPHAPAMDPRVCRVMQTMRNQAGTQVKRSDAAAWAHLSESRFNHVFASHCGVSFRSYRIWCQLRVAMAAMAANVRLTDAAMAGAFADSAHFSKRFREI
ncbi:MAG: helix-turn-helix domain-containing protein, partial [Burkholderiaceae bacterium]